MINYKGGPGNNGVHLGGAVSGAGVQGACILYVYIHSVTSRRVRSEVNPVEISSTISHWEV